MIVTLFGTSTVFAANNSLINLDSTVLATPITDSLKIEDTLVKKDSVDKKDCEIKDIPDLLGELFSGKKKKEKDKRKDNQCKKQVKDDHIL